MNKIVKFSLKAVYYFFFFMGVAVSFGEKQDLSGWHEGLEQINKL